jgi:hypothetical protein
MLKKFSSVLLENSSKRALASLILTVSIEISTRRDTAATLENKAVLAQLLRVHTALLIAWKGVNTYCSPEAYAEAFDTYAVSLPILLKRVLDARVSHFRVSIMDDLETPLFAGSLQNSSKMEATEQMLVLVAS